LFQGVPFNLCLHLVLQAQAQIQVAREMADAEVLAERNRAALELERLKHDNLAAEEEYRQRGYEAGIEEANRIAELARREAANAEAEVCDLQELVDDLRHRNDHMLGENKRLNEEIQSLKTMGDSRVSGSTIEDVRALHYEIEAQAQSRAAAEAAKADLVGLVKSATKRYEEAESELKKLRKENKKMAETLGDRQVSTDCFVHSTHRFTKIHSR